MCWLSAGLQCALAAVWALGSGVGRAASTVWTLLQEHRKAFQTMWLSFLKHKVGARLVGEGGGSTQVSPRAEASP